MASELLTTFAQETKLASITLIPKSPPLSPGGIFRVISNDDNGETVLWDRSVEGRFPEAKEVKQALRDVVNPAKDLGHSDVKNETKTTEGECLECKENENNKSIEQEATNKSALGAPGQPIFPTEFYEKNRITIEYSTGSTISCVENNMHNAIWHANELLNMVYERNAWWKANKDRPPEDLGNAVVPASVDGVTLIPIRDQSNVLVCNSFCNDAFLSVRMRC
jgi:selenoprotein W-related protein